ncbi:MAG: GNAT family N-acetyltransferase [Alphaproteobacteria bacterium]
MAEIGEFGIDSQGLGDLTVRVAATADIEAVSGLDERITGLAKPDYWRASFANFSGRPDGYFLIAEADGRFCGFIIGEVRAWEFGSSPCGWIFAIGVDPGQRLRKVGSRLFATLTQRMRADGVKTVRTMLGRDDALNMSFFRSQGMMGGPFIQLEMPLFNHG